MLNCVVGWANLIIQINSDNVQHKLQAFYLQGGILLQRKSSLLPDSGQSYSNQKPVIVQERCQTMGSFELNKHCQVKDRDGGVEDEIQNNDH